MATIEVPDDPHVPGTLLHSSVSQKSGAFTSRWKFLNSLYVHLHGGWHATILSHDECYHSTTLLFLFACSLFVAPLDPESQFIPIYILLFTHKFQNPPAPKRHHQFTNSQPFYLLPPPLGAASISIGAASSSTGMKAS
jgi:hypothetical protein